MYDFVCMFWMYIMYEFVCLFVLDVYALIKV